MQPKNLFHLFLLLFVVGCASSPKPLKDLPKGRDEERKENFGKAFGAEFLIFGKPTHQEAQFGTGMSANPYLWQASLETLSFMPLVSADAVGGVIITDWYMTTSSKAERIKVTVYITDRQLRADAIKVLIHKEVLRNGTWVSATADQATARQLEDIILSKARDLKIQKAQQGKN